MGNNAARSIVLDILIEVFEKDRLSHLAIRDALKNNKIESRSDRAFIKRLAEGTIERLIELDYIIDIFSKVKVNKQKPVIRNILRMSVYQIKYMDSVPDSAVCNEAVKLASKRGFYNLKGFVNGVLRSILRNPEKIIVPEDNLSIVYSMPQWIIDLWIDEYGKERTISMLESSQKEKRTCIRRNISIISEDDFEKALIEEKIQFEKSPLCDYVYYIKGASGIGDINAFRKGYFQVQDISSVMVGLAANVKKDMICIDVCAAPGGKTMHIADLLDGTGRVYSRDISEEKVKLIEENIVRAGFKNVETLVFDAAKTDESMVGKCDLVICDLPCSGLGVMAGKSDIKYKTTYQDILDLAKIQKNILLTAKKYLKKNGCLIFSTCTVNKIENDDNAEWIKETLGLEPYSLEKIIPCGNTYPTAREGYIQIFPGDDMDGFFVSAFKNM